MKGDNPIQMKSYAFALRIVKLYRYLCDEKREFVLSNQIVRSGTSIGANVEKAIIETMIHSDTAKCGPLTSWELETPLHLPGPVDCHLAAAMPALAPSLPMDSIL